MSDANEAGKRDRPWMMRTYAGHSSASASNALFRTNLAKGQTGLSVAFDLPTQTGYDPDSPMAAGEVGKVGVPIAHLGDMRTLFREIPLDQMNTSMTINATAMWLFALYIAVGEEQGALRRLSQSSSCHVRTACQRPAASRPDWTSVPFRGPQRDIENGW